ncbi:MAG: HIP---CoA ligase [Actinomycetota bacterium]|jgi:acyl-CoA synthetase (AMP-forming)/AMP-acid ligase II|nr:HIP---CoA ligase [Actinomycetota bacterium]MDQ1477273.1 HIP---CoA ligase [Actinomycetota bacterium]
MTDDQLPSTIPGLVDRAAASFPELEALVDPQMRLTFPQLAEEVGRAGRALVASGIEPGDRVAIWAPNCSEWVIAALGTLAAGAVIVPPNTRFKGAEARYVLERADVKLLFTVTDFLDTNYEALLRAEPELPLLREIIDLRGPAWSEFLARDTGSEKLPETRTGDDLCAVLFTSGTTGRPKGAMLTHGATVRAYDAWSTEVGLRAGDRYLVVNPFFHSFGLNAGIVASLVKGATIIPHAVFDVDAVMTRAADEHVSMLPGPPTVYQSILDHPRLSEFDMSSLRLAVTGAAPVPVELIRRMRAELGFETIVTGYGLTEATGIATMCRHDDDPETISNTSGRAIPDVEVLVVDEKNVEVPRGEPGEVVIRGYNIMRGFIHDPEGTAEAIDADGWLHTGDIAVMNERGYITITDRTKDMFIVGGFNAYPAEIENMISDHPAVGQVAVVGIPDGRMGEVGYAYVIPRLNATVTPDELRAWCREKMANYKVPRYFEIVDAVPLNASGKVLKYELRERARATLG